MLFVFRPSCCLLFFVLASLPVRADTEKLLSVRSDDPQLALSAKRAGSSENIDTLGMHLDLGLGEIGMTRFAVNAASLDSAGPRLQTIKLDHQLDLSDSLLMPLPGKLDLGLHVIRRLDKDSANTWDMGLKPQLKTQFGPLALKFGMSVVRAVDTGRELAFGYTWASSVDLTPRLSLDLAGKGLKRYDRGLADSGGDTLTPKISGRYRLDRSLAFSYGLGAQFDLNSKETKPDLNLNVELKF